MYHSIMRTENGNETMEGGTMKTMTLRQSAKLGEKILAEVTALRDSQANPKGYKAWQKLSDLKAVQKVAMYSTGVLK